jgi:hypothetical protein
MVKRIKHISALPGWYSLEKYNKAETLDAAGWYEQLSVRADMSVMIEGRRGQTWQNGELPSISRQTAQALDLIRATPIVDLTGDGLLHALFHGGALAELKSCDPLYTPGVHLITVRNHYMTERSVQKEKRTHARSFFNQFDDRDSLKPLEYKAREWMDQPIDWISGGSGVCANTQVNLLLPDKVLIAQFKQFLKDRRNALQRAGASIENRQKPDFAAWRRFGVLPYLDLRMWEHEAGIKLSNRVMADAIFPPGEGGEEVVRKTTAKLAHLLLTRKHLETLAAIAAQEITERNNAQTFPEKK